MFSVTALVLAALGVHPVLSGPAGFIGAAGVSGLLGLNFFSSPAIKKGIVSKLLVLLMSVSLLQGCAVAVMAVAETAIVLTAAGVKQISDQSDANGAGGNRFVDLGDGTVRDTSTGLIWLKDANCFGKKNWDDAMDKAAALHTGECGLTDGSSKGDWRLPTKEEWEAFVDTNYDGPALSNAAGTGKWSEGDAFNNVQSRFYWSRTTYEAGTDDAWGVGMSYGNVHGYNKSYYYYVWPVRGGN